VTAGSCHFLPATMRPAAAPGAMRIFLSTFLVFVISGVAVATAPGGGGGGGTGGSTTCARCTDATSGTQCTGGYPSGGSTCHVECEWHDPDWTECSCWTTGDCPKPSGGGGTGTHRQ